MSFAEVATFLEHFEKYVRLLVPLMSRDLPLADNLWRRVFAIKEFPCHRYSVQKGSFLFKKSTSNLFTSAELNKWWKERLNTYFRHKVSSEKDFCLASQRFMLPCLYFGVDGHCYESCSDTRLSKSMPTTADYNMKINLFLQQIRILNLTYSALPQKQDLYTRYSFYLSSYSVVVNRSRMQHARMATPFVSSSLSYNPFPWFGRWSESILHSRFFGVHWGCTEMDSRTCQMDHTWWQPTRVPGGGSEVDPTCVSIQLSTPTHRLCLTSSCALRWAATLSG